MLKMRIIIESDSILDLTAVGNNLMLEAFEHGIDATSISIENQSNTDYGWRLAVLLHDDHAQDAIDRNMRRVRALAKAQAAAAGDETETTVDVDDIPF